MHILIYSKYTNITIIIDSTINFYNSCFKLYIFYA